MAALRANTFGNHQTILQQLQDYAREHAPPTSFPFHFFGITNFPDHDKELVAYRKKLESVRCRQCNISIRMDANMLVERTKVMLREIGK